MALGRRNIEDKYLPSDASQNPVVSEAEDGAPSSGQPWPELCLAGAV
jgi:hypothetical protein